jgi:CDP-glucose 4,6-dehydratase
MEKLEVKNIIMKEVLNFYKNKKIFITGHTGFKGSWLTHLLIENGSVIKGYSKEPVTNPSLYYLLGLDKKVNSIINDINSFTSIEEEILDFKPDFIFHLAAQPLVRYSYSNTLETHTTNIIGTANVLESARKLSNNCVIVCITTDKVYKNKEWEFPYRETDELGGYDPYSSSKAAAELIISSFRESFFSTGNIQVATVRAGNVIGGGDWSHDRLIPDIVRGISNNEKVEIRNLNSIRPWQHVLDPLLGYLTLAMQMSKYPRKFDQAWNFGPQNNEVKSVMEVLNIFYRANNLQCDYEISKKSNAHEAGILKLDISKSMSLLNWKPIIDTNTAIEITANWYKLYMKGMSAIELVNNDIKYFLK